MPLVPGDAAGDDGVDESAHNNNRGMRMKASLRRAAGVVGALLLAGCAMLPAHEAAAAERAAHTMPDARFAEALRTCRFLRGGRPGIERREAARDGRLRGCLARRGWQPDGTPTLASLVPPQGEAMPSASATNAH